MPNDPRIAPCFAASSWPVTTTAKPSGGVMGIGVGTYVTEGVGVGVGAGVRVGVGDGIWVGVGVAVGV